MVFVVILAFLLANAVYLYNINARVDANINQKKELVSLLILNNELDNVYEKQMNFQNFDAINKVVKRFDKIIENFGENDMIKHYFDDKSDTNLYKRVVEKFETKKRLIRKFASDDALLTSSMKNLTRTFNKYQSKEASSTKRLVDELYLGILQVKSGNKVDRGILNREIDKALKKEYPIDVHNYFLHAQVSLVYLQKTSSQKIQNENIDMEKAIEEFRQRFDMYADSLVDQLYANMALFMLMIVLFIAAVSVLVSKNKEQTKNLLQFRQVIQNSDNSIIMTDKTHKITYVNEAFEKASGYSQKEVIGQTPAILQSGLHDKSFYKSLNQQLREEKGWSGEFANRRKDGKIVYEKASIFPLKNDKDELEGYLGIKLDITSEKSHLQEIESKNMEILTRYQIDETTGLWSRNVLDDELTKKTKGYLIYMKINNFRDIRFFYGTTVSNAVIEKVSYNMKRFISIYGISGQPFRVGEDDFCIWYKHKKPPIDLVASILTYMHSNPVEMDGAIHQIDLLVGVSSEKDLPQGDRLLQGIIALLKAQKNGMQYVYYEVNNELEREYRHNIVVAQRIRNALNEDLVTVQCQPIYDTQTQEIYCYEVLMRMHDETGRMMYPGEFLDVAKQSSLYTYLMRHVIIHVFKLVKSYPNMRFSVNMSIIDMMDKETTDLFVEQLEASENPQNVIIEILEQEGIGNYDAIRPFLDEAKNYGCLISIDDFGSGYSNYSRIIQLEIDHIKIDGSIIKELPYDKNSRVVVETIIGFARRKGCEVVAEFVSNEDIFEEVKAYGIEYTQGFYLGKPAELKIFDDDKIKTA